MCTQRPSEWICHFGREQHVCFHFLYKMTVMTYILSTQQICVNTGDDHFLLQHESAQCTKPGSLRKAWSGRAWHDCTEPWRQRHPPPSRWIPAQLPVDIRVGLHWCLCGCVGANPCSQVIKSGRREELLCPQVGNKMVNDHMSTYFWPDYWTLSSSVTIRCQIDWANTQKNFKSLHFHGRLWAPYFERTQFYFLTFCLFASFLPPHPLINPFWCQSHLTLSTLTL